MSEAPVHLAEDSPEGYPAHWEADVVLRDGSVAHLRPIAPTDADALRRFHAGQSDESIYLRFFAPLRELSERDVHRFTNVDFDQRVALVATVRDDIIGVGRYDKVDETSAEVAFNISDHYQGRGVGSMLLEHLAAIAQDAGVDHFVAEVLPQNRKMLTVFREAGYEVSQRFEDGIIMVDFDVAATERSTEVMFSREHRAESISVRRVLHPSSVAVIGASRREDSIGHHLLANILAAGFAGPVYAVNATATEVCGLPAYPRIGDVPGRVDLAVIAVPAAGVVDVARQCGLAGVRALVIASGGFAEAGPLGAARQEALRWEARHGGMRVVGPSSFGVVNQDPQVRLNASLAKQLPPPGRFGLFAQSGALGIAVLASAARHNLGVSVFASAGNRIDLSGNDLMQYWIDDDDTAAVGLYIESMGNPRKFSRIARQLATSKPVIVVKAGASTYGSPPGHTIRPTQVRPEVFDSMLRQVGVIRVTNIHQLFDVAQLVVYQPLPGGQRVAVVTNSVSLGAITAQSCLSWGLEVTHGPVSLASEASAADFGTALDAAFADDAVDSVVTCFIPPLVTRNEEVIEVVKAISATSSKPCVATFLGVFGVTESPNGVSPHAAGQTRALPGYSMPEDAVRALAAATRYAQWRARDHGTVLDPPGIHRAAARSFVEDLLDATPQGRDLTHPEATQLLAAYGIRLWPSHHALGADEAVAAAHELGYPVIVKAASHVVRHQPGMRAVQGDLTDARDVRWAMRVIHDRLGEYAAEGVVVQRMATPGVACVLSAIEDPLFGPVVSFSVAGPPTDLLGDIAHRIAPLTDVDISDLLDAIKAAPMLSGHRGAEPVDRAALAELVARVSALADDLPEVEVVELNPVNACPGGVDVLGARVVVGPAPERADDDRRTLT